MKSENNEMNAKQRRNASFVLVVLPKAKSENNEKDARHTRKRAPQFADANEETRLSKYNEADARYFQFFRLRPAPT